MSMVAFQTSARSNAARRTAAGWLLSLCCLVLPAVVPAAIAPSDSTEDILYSADGGGSIETVGNVRTTTLRGNVRIQQGLITIFGDTATLEQDVSSGDLIRVTVEGEPARFVRDAEDSAETINGSSARIVYYNQPDTRSDNQALLSVVEFQGQASFTRGRTALECSQIKHIVETGATDSPGPCSGVLAPIE